MAGEYGLARMMGIADIFDVFVRDKVYMLYAKAFLAKNQLDEVNHADIPGYED